MLLISYNYLSINGGIMSYLKNIRFFGLILSFMFLTFLGCSDENMISDNNQSLESELSLNSIPKSSEGEVPSSELQFMREEEKLARDIYQLMYSKYQLFVFRNISKSEQAHMNAIKVLLDRYAIEDPVGSNGVGVFTNPELQSLFNSLKMQGDSSVISALKVGAAIEEIDILDIKEILMLGNLSADVRFVLTNLMNASKQHLRAFVGNLRVRGIIYSPQYLSQNEYNEIINRK